MGYQINNANLTLLRERWMKDADQFCGYVGNFVVGVSVVLSAGYMAPMLVEGLPALYSTGSTYGGAALSLTTNVGRYAVRGLWEGAKLYHTNVGMRGGYLNMGLNYINQSYVSDKWGLEGKSLTGLIVAGSFRSGSSIYGQAAAGAADPILQIKYGGNGLYGAGYLLDNKQSLGQTAALSTIGIFNSLYMGTPLLKSSFGNYLISNGLLAPSQKAVEQGIENNL